MRLIPAATVPRAFTQGETTCSTGFPVGSRQEGLLLYLSSMLQNYLRKQILLTVGSTTVTVVICVALEHYEPQFIDLNSNLIGRSIQVIAKPLCHKRNTKSIIELYQ